MNTWTGLGVSQSDIFKLPIKLFFEVFEGARDELRMSLKAYLILGALLVIGGLAINMSYGYLPVVVINILIIGSQIISVLIGYFIYKERLSIKQWIGLALIIASFFVVAAVS